MLTTKLALGTGISLFLSFQRILHFAVVTNDFITNGYPSSFRLVARCLMMPRFLERISCSLLLHQQQTASCNGNAIRLFEICTLSAILSMLLIERISSQEIPTNKNTWRSIENVAASFVRNIAM